ncbi:two-component system NtrC family sensor kinase [Pedobacter sp. UYEF25]
MKTKKKFFYSHTKQYVIGLLRENFIRQMPYCNAATFYTIAFLFFTIPVTSSAQAFSVIKLKKQINVFKTKENYLTDTIYFNRVISLGFFYADQYPDSALVLLPPITQQCRAAGYLLGEVNSITALGNAWLTKGNSKRAFNLYQQAYGLAESNRLEQAKPDILGNIAIIYLNRGNYTVALEKFYQSLHLAEKRGDKFLIRSTLNNIGTIQFYQGKMSDAEAAFLKTLKISKELADTQNIVLSYNNIGEVNIEQGQIQKAIKNLAIAYTLSAQKNMPDMKASISNTLGDAYYRIDSLQSAATYFNSALKTAQKTDNARAIAKAEIGLAKLNNKNKQYMRALYFGLDAIKRAENMGQVQLQRDAMAVVADIYEQIGDDKNALFYFKRYKRFADSLVNISNERISANLKADYEIAKKEEIFKSKTSQQRWWIFSALAGLFSALIIIIQIYRNKKKLGETYRQLQEKTGIIEAQKIEVENTLAELKTTQKQLVQNEKMASLGELTAGIAHEIQNPLNFVNNFSELSNELIDEMIGQLDKGNSVEVKAIAKDIKQNLERINNHGKRADAIVRAMLQHSRTSSGAKEPTNINALCDEYLRLSYHGLRAKDKSFNAELKTDFDNSIGKISIVPQDIGRVILNLLTNAFYAVNEKRLHVETDNHYQPMVSVSTKAVKLPSGRLEVTIGVADNGNGIPERIVEKIFQPFFTTKPTGKGTGLGLSLSYDIVHAHGGKIKVETKDKIGTNFIITLPTIG